MLPALLRIPELRDEHCGVDLVVESFLGGGTCGNSLVGVEPDEVLGAATVKRADGPRGLSQPLGIRGADRALLDGAASGLRGQRDHFCCQSGRQALHRKSK